MEKSLLNLLFKYKGTITHREFQVGIIILFMLFVFDILVMSAYMSTQSAIAASGIEHISAFTGYNNIVSFFVPMLIPSQFILTYSSFVLSYKRVRAISKNRFTAVLSGLTNYLFFASVPSLLMYAKMRISDIPSDHSYFKLVEPTIVSVLLIFFVVGVVNLIVCAKQRNDIILLQQVKGRLDIYGYIIKLGIVLGVLSIFAIIFSGFILVSPHLLKYPLMIRMVFKIAILIALVFYIKYTIFRFKDAGVPVVYFIIILATCIALIAVRSWMITTHHSLLYAFSTLFSTASNLIFAAQLLLFLLPTKNKVSATVEFKNT